ncbi:MAG: XRE family transcriptional regulator [Nocardioidaceae bacterium]
MTRRNEEGPSDPPSSQDAMRATIARRLRDYRLDLDWTMTQLAGRSGVSKAMLSKIENAQTTPALTTLSRLGDALAVPVTAFFRGLDDEQDMLHVKAGQGLDIHHRSSRVGRSYQSLGRMRFPHDRLEPTLVTIDRDDEPFPLYQHGGSELIYVISGRLEYCYGRRTVLLEPGDSLQLLGEVLHGPGKLIELPIQMLSAKAVSSEG